MCVYYHNDQPYLVSESDDNTIKIWSLDNIELVTTLEQGVNDIWSLVVIDHYDEKLIANGDIFGCITLWSLTDYACLGTFKARSYSIHTLQVLRYNGQMRLATPGDDEEINLMDPRNNCIIESWEVGSSFPRLKVMMNGIGRNENIPLWMK